jgi:hypothetical protein
MADVDRFCRDLAANECVVDRDDQAGTVIARDGEHEVFKAIQKGRDQPWIAIFINAGRFMWFNQRVE